MVWGCMLEWYRSTNGAGGRLGIENGGDFKSGLRWECQDGISECQMDGCNRDLFLYCDRRPTSGRGAVGCKGVEDGAVGCQLRGQ